MAGTLPQNRGNKTANRVGSTVSRYLKAAGWNISPAARRHRYNGIFVSAQADHVSIVVDLGDAVRNRAVADEMARQLSVWSITGDAGPRVSDPDDSDTCFVHFTYHKR